MEAYLYSYQLVEKKLRKDPKQQNCVEHNLGIMLLNKY